MYGVYLGFPTVLHMLICVYVSSAAAQSPVVYQARASPVRHASLHYPAPEWVREFLPSPTHNKGPTLPLTAIFTTALYHGTTTATIPHIITSAKGNFSTKERVNLACSTA